MFLVGVIGAITALAHPGTAPAGTQRDMEGNFVQLDPGTVPDKTTMKQVNATVDTTKRIVVPSVGLNAPLGAITAVNGVLTPPGFTSVYSVRNVGARVDDPDSGTVYLVTHSLRNGGKAPGNYLIDVDNHRAAVRPGAKIITAGITYTVTGSRAVAKRTIGDDPNLWADIPNRLVIITCLQVPTRTESSDNLIITAARTG